MFLRRYERPSGGRKRTYWALCESVRTQGGSRQRVVAYLGELARNERNGWAQLGRSLSGKQRPSLRCSIRRTTTSRGRRAGAGGCAGVRLERLRDFGDVWMAWGLWRLLGLDTFLGARRASGQEEVAWPVVAAILTIARFCEPSSELHIETTWYRRTALEDFLGVPVEKVHTDRLYEGLDWLLPHKAAMEKHLKERLGGLFDLEYDLLLYDVTSTYFEGQCAATVWRNGATRVTVARIACKFASAWWSPRTGFPWVTRSSPGNRNDSTTVEEIVEAMEAKYGRVNRIWVMDRGMVSEENLKFLRRARWPVHRGHAQGDAATVRGTSDPQGLARGPRGRGGAAGAGARRGRDVRPGPQRRSPREGEGDAPALRRAAGGGAAEDAGFGGQRAA